MWTKSSKTENIMKYKVYLFRSGPDGRGPVEMNKINLL